MRESSGSSLAVDATLQRLLARIQSRFPIKQETLPIGDLQISFTRVLDPDQVCEASVDQSQASPGVEPAWQPYWAESWDSAYSLARLLVQENVAGTQLLELGCGLGLVGSIAAACGATVTMVDAAQPALLFAQLNSWRWRRRVSVQRLDWRRDTLARRFSLIVGADILYDRGDWIHLERFWRQHLDEPGRVLLAEPGRTTGTEFLDWISDQGWSLRQIAAEDQQKGDKMRILELRLA